MCFICHGCKECAHFGDCTHEHTCDDLGERCEICTFECGEFLVDDPSFWDED